MQNMPYLPKFLYLWSTVTTVYVTHVISFIAAHVACATCCWRL